MQKPLRYIINDWKEAYGEEKVPASGVRYKMIPKETRQDLLEILVQTLVDGGVSSRGYFEGTNQRLIVEACVPKDSKYKDSLKKMTQATIRDLEAAVTRVFMRLESGQKFTVEGADQIPEQPAPPAPFTKEELTPTAPPVTAKQPDNEPTESEPEYDDNDGVSEYAQRLLQKPFVAPAETPKVESNDLNHELLAEFGLDPKEFGWSNE